MRSYLRMATCYPGRAFRAAAEILDTLKRGLDDPLTSMPPVRLGRGKRAASSLHHFGGTPHGDDEMHLALP